MRASIRLAFYGLLLAGLSSTVFKAARADDTPILNVLKTVSTVASTVPANGDVNPYGIVRVETSIGKLEAGHILVSNFNNSGNAQGTGTTIVDISPGGVVAVFAQIDPTKLPGPCPGGVGLTTALAVLRSGWVIVGSLPTNNGALEPSGSGCLIVIDKNGNPVQTIYGSLINGPWDMTWIERGELTMLFVTNVLENTLAANGGVVHRGYITRITLGTSPTTTPRVNAITVIGSGFDQRTDPAALVLGITGVGLSPSSDNDTADSFTDADHDRVLYVADTLNNRIRAIPDPIFRPSSGGIGKLVASGGKLNQPLGLTVAPNGHILTVNGADGFIVEFDETGKQIASKLIDNTGGPPPGAGTLFGLIYVPDWGIYFVDDGSNTLNLLH
jgi:hypothetical protein